MRRIFALSIFIFIVIFIGNAYAPDEQKFKVCLFITCNDADTESFIKSYIRRELRGLRDVEIVNIENSDDMLNSWKGGWNSGRFDLEIFAMKIKTTEIISIFYEFRERFNHLNIKAEIKNRYYDIEKVRTRLEKFESSLSEEQKTEFSTLTMFLYHPTFDENSGMASIGKDRLEEACKKIVVDFDTNVLEEAREEK